MFICLDLVVADHALEGLHMHVLDNYIAMCKELDPLAATESQLRSTQPFLDKCDMCLESSDTD